MVLGVILIQDVLTIKSKDEGCQFVNDGYQRASRMTSKTSQHLALDTADVNCSVLRVCRQLNTEGTDILYSRNTFAMPYAYLGGFIDKIGPINKSRLTRLVVDYPRQSGHELSFVPGHPLLGYLSPKSGLSNLTTLVITGVEFEQYRRLDRELEALGQPAHPTVPKIVSKSECRKTPRSFLPQVTRVISAPLQIYVEILQHAKNT